MQASKVSFPGSQGPSFLRNPTPAPGGVPDIRRGARLQTQAQQRTEMPPAPAPLSGREWSNALANWVRDHTVSPAWDCNTRLELPRHGLTQWMFRELAHELPASGEHALRAYPAYALAALLAPMAGLHPEHREAQINGAVAQAAIRPDSLWLNRATITRLLRSLFGNEVVAHPPGEHPLPLEIENLKFWAAVRGNGELWVSDARWGETGAFLIEYPHLDVGMSPADRMNGKLKISWDANLKKFYDPADMPTVLTWSGLPEDSVVAPWAITAKHSAHSMLDLLTTVAFEPVNLLPSTSTAPIHTLWPSNLHVSLIDTAGHRVAGSVQEKSELLCHMEAWLAGLRFEKLHRHEYGTAGNMDAAALLSVLSASVNQCPIEQRLIDLLNMAQAKKVNWASLHNLPDGEWLQGVLEDLLGARCRSAQCSFGTAGSNLPSSLTRAGGSEFGTLEVWISPQHLAERQHPDEQTGRLNIHVSGPLFGNMPVTLSRNYTLRSESEYFPGDLRVVLGETKPPSVTADSKRLLFRFAANDERESLGGLENRALAHREFWNALLDFNAPHSV